MTAETTNNPDFLLLNSSNLLTLRGPEAPRSGEAANSIEIIENGGVAVLKDRILKVGTTSELVKTYPDCNKIIDAKGLLLMPGFVDCHTHLVFNGNRIGEMELRLNGANYIDILKAGGGINSTVRETRAASGEELFRSASRWMDRMLTHGTTTVEIKSGYGLSYESEKKILSVIGRLKKTHQMDIAATYLGAHTIPKGENREKYLEWLTGNSLLEFREMADFFDVFCEEGAFSLPETAKLLRAAKEAGFGLKVHAGQFNDLGAPGMAAGLEAVSADHMENVSDDQLERMALSNTIAVLMPGVPFFLKTGIYPENTRFRDHLVPTAIATDFNPGSCPCYSMQMVIALAVLYCGMTVSEALTSATYNAACAIKKEKEVGSLEEGKKADIIGINASSPGEIPYHFGTNLVNLVIKGGLRYSR